MENIRKQTKHNNKTIHTSKKTNISKKRKHEIAQNAGLDIKKRKRKHVSTFSKISY